MTSAAADMYSQSLLLPMITPTIGALLSAILHPHAGDVGICKADCSMPACQVAAGMSVVENSAQCIRDGDADSDQSMRVRARRSCRGYRRYLRPDRLRPLDRLVR